MKLRILIGALALGALVPALSVSAPTDIRSCKSFTYKGTTVTGVRVLHTRLGNVSCKQAVSLLKDYYDTMTPALYRSNPNHRVSLHRHRNWILAPTSGGPGIRRNPIGWPAVVARGPITLGGTGASPAPTTPEPKPANCVGKPTASFSTEQLPSNLVVFTDQTQVPYCYSPTTSRWDFGDPASNAVVSNVATGVGHQYSAPGTYHVVLTVTDVDKTQYTYAADVSVTFVDPNAPADPVSVGGGGIG